MTRRPTSRGKAAKSRQPKATGPKGVAGQGTVVARLTRERDEALLREAANSEILRLISKSGVLETVFRTILENATRICNANFGVLNLHENGALRMGAMHNVPKACAEWLQERRGAYKPIAGSPPDRVMRTKKVSYTVDNATEATPAAQPCLAARDLQSVCQCSRMTSWSAQLLFIVRRSGRSPKNKLNCYKALPPRQ